MVSEYLGVVWLAWCSVVLCSAILGLSWLVGLRQPDIEKVSVYECGFDPFVSPRIPFSVKFYLVGLLFLVFDLEVSWLFPWSVMVGDLETQGLWVVFLFLLILTVGLVYEWVRGGLEWEE